jgi:hypothetical protein
MKQYRIALLCLACLAAICPALPAATLYGNNATGGTPYVYIIDSTTMTVTQTLTNLSSVNGRGVVVVGSTLYYTAANSNDVFSYNLSNDTDAGVAFAVSGATGLSTMAFDGTDFWIGDYSGTNHAFLYSPTGTLLKTINLSDCTGFCDGLEYFTDSNGNARLISNEGDAATPGIYDVYDTNGVLISHNFINTGISASGAGIAYNGTDFFVSNIYQGTISTYSNTGTFIQTQPITGFSSGHSPLVEDLSLGSPEPGTLTTLGAGLLGFACFVRRRRAAVRA